MNTIQPLFRKTLLPLLALMAFAVRAQAEGATAYAVWCANNTTLYFFGSETTLESGGTYTPEGTTDPVTITNVWSGTAVTATGTGKPGWYNTVKSALTNVVFESSFATVTPTSLRYWFQDCTKLAAVTGISNLNTSAVTTMYSMFEKCSQLSALDLSTFNTSAVTDMQYMFYNCQALTTLDLSSFNTGNVTTMYQMFYGCAGLQSVNLSGWTNTKVTNMSQMFIGCSALTTLNLTGFNTSAVQNMSSMFKNCTSLTSIDLSSFDTGNVITTQEMFNGCTNLERINLSGWANTKLTNLSNMFRDCKKLSTLTLTGFQTSAATTFNSMFVNCQALESINLSGFNTEKVSDMQYMFYGCSALQNLDLSTFNTGAVTSMYQMFYNCTALQSVNLSGWANTKVTNMSQMFYNCTSLTSPNFTNFNTSAVQNMSNMFSNCKALTSLNLSSFNTANVTNMGYMFQNCLLLGSLDLSGFNTAKVTNMQYVFDGCNALASVDVSNFNTTNVTNMSCMFQNCQTLTGLELSSFNTAKVTNMSSMFNGCSNLEDIYVSLAWTTGLVNSSSNMFKSCSSLVGQDGTTLATYNNSSLDRTHATDEAGGYLKTGTTTDLEEPLAYAIWCADNATLYFLQSNKQLVTGRSFTPNGSNTPVRMTTVWSGTQVTATGNNSPSWLSTVKTTMQHVVFEPSFANVTPNSLYYWFYQCSALTTVEGFANLTTTSVTNMGYMFSGATALQSLDLSGFNTASATNMSYMFQNCSNLSSLNISGFNTEKVTDMRYMFSGCANLTSLDLSSFNTVKVSNVSYMFNGCTLLQSIYVGSYWALGQITNTNNHANMFTGCTSIVGQDGVTTYDANYVNKTLAHSGDGGYLRAGTETTADEEVYAVWCAENTTLYFLKTTKPHIQYGFFKPAGTNTTLAITNVWKGTAVTATSTSGTPGWNNTVKGTLTTAVFEPSFADVTPTSLRGWFYQCSKLTAVTGIANLNTSAVENMAYMFSGCTTLPSIDLLDFDTRQVTKMDNMFQSCSSLTELDLSSFSYGGSGTVSRGNMFNGCTNLASIYVIDLGATANTGSGIFTGCNSIVGESGTTYNSNQTGSAMLNYDNGYLRNGRSARVFWCSASGTLHFTTINRNETPQAGDSFTPEEGEAETITDIWSAEDVTDIGTSLPGWNSVAASVQQVVIESGFSYVRANSLYGWFEGMSHITAINGIDRLANSATTATTMSRMFKDCTSLTSLDLSVFNTANVTDMSQMFSGCSNLEIITADADWTTASVTSSDDMFNGCTSIVGQDGTTYDGSVVDKTRAHYSTGGYLRGVLRPYVVLCKSVNNGTLYFLAETSAFAEATTYTPSGSDTPQAINFLWTEEDMGSVNSNPAWVNNDNARPYIYHVVVDPSFAIFRPTSLRAWFMGCNNLRDLTGLENLNTSQVTTMLATFERCGNLETIDLSMLDVSNVTDMNSLFLDSYGLKSINVSGWNTSKVTEMNNMFSSTTYQDYTLKSLDLSSFDTHNVTDMGYMFASRSGLKTIYVGESWNTDKVVGQYPGGYAMFNKCNALVGQDGTTYNQYNTSAEFAHYGTGGYLTLKETQAAYAIWCAANETLYFTYSDESYVAGGTFTPAGSNTPLTITALWYDKEVTDYIHYGSIAGTPGWTSAIINDEEHPLKHVVFEPSFANVTLTTTRYWFSSLQKLENISGIEYLNTANVTDMSCMFQLCLNLESIDLSHLNTDNVTNMSGMFNFCRSLQTINVSGLNTDNVTNMSSMFVACKGLTTLDLSTFNTANVTDMSYMFDGNNLLASIDLSSFNTGAVTNMAYMFAECPLLSTLDLSHFNTANVNNMRNMFSESTGLTTLNLSSFNTAKVSNMLQMFYRCNNLTSLDLSNFNTSLLSATANMFSGCHNLTTLDISGFNTSNIVSMMAMFSGCSSLTSLDLSSFNTSNVTNMYAMFDNCSNLKDIFVSDNWTTAALSEAVYTGAGYVNGKAEIFTNCTAIEGEDGTTYTSGNNSSAYAHTGEGGYLKLKPVNNDIADMAATPLTLEAVQAGTITITNVNALTLNYTSSVSGAHSSSANSIVIEVTAGETIALACANTTAGMNFNISSTNDVYVYGNALSLVFGSNFVGQTDLSECEYGILACLFCLGPEGETLNPTIKNHPTKDIVLPATTLSDGCYLAMFSGCSNLTRGPQLPATTLAEDCYHRMFEYSGLVMAPALPAIALSGQVYGGMFDHCANLRYVKCLATDIVDTSHGEDATTDCWLANVAATGTFVKADAADWSVKNKTGAIINGIPAGWTVLDASDFDPYATPLTLEAVEAGTINIHNPNTLTIEYSKDGSTWTVANSNPISITVAAGDQVCFRGDNPAYGMVDMATGERYTRFTATNDVYIYGNVMSLISSEGYMTLATLPVVGSDDQYDMDINLAFLFSTPTDDADWAPKDNTTIKNHPTKDIVLPAINVTRSGYMYMFSGCQGLTRAPELPATDLGWGCYHQMFSNCISLTAAPELPATTVPMEGYSYMFNRCSSLNYVKCLATDISAEGCTGGWLTDVAPAGTFIKAAGMDDWTVGPLGEWNEVNGIPSGWTVKSDGEYTVTIPTSGIATFSAIDNLGVPEGLTAYICTAFDNDGTDGPAITATPISGSVIPARTGVLLRGTAGQYTLTATTAEAPAIDNNMLAAVTEATHIEPTSGIYTNFMLKNGTFVRIAASASTSKMAAGKAYLQIPTENIPASKQVKLMWLDGSDVATRMRMNGNVNENGDVFDLSGRRIAHASANSPQFKRARGMYIINGKKAVR